MTGSPTIVFSRDETLVARGLVNAIAVAAAICAYHYFFGSEGAIWESKPEAAMLIIGILGTYLDLKHHYRKLPDQVEITDDSLIIRKSDRTEERIDLTLVREFRRLENHLEISLQGETGARVIELSSRASVKLVEKLTEQLDFELWESGIMSGRYWPREYMPSREALAVSNDLRCRSCGRNYPSKYWFIDDFGIPTIECRSCQTDREKSVTAVSGVGALIRDDDGNAG